MVVPVFNQFLFQVVALLLLSGGCLAVWRQIGSPAGVDGRLARSFVGVSAALVLIVIVFNSLIDPYGSLGTGLVETNTLPDRHIKPALIEALPSAPQVLILGSSRSELLDPSVLESTCGLTAFNASLFSAAAEEYLALWRFTLRTQGAPRALIIGLDLEEAFLPVLEYEAALVGTPLYRDVDISFSKRALGYFDFFSQLASRQMTEESLHMVSLILRGLPPPRFSLAPNGKLIVNQHQADDGLVRAPIVIMPKDIDDEHFAAFDARRVADFRRLVADAAAHHTQVYVFFTPLHEDYAAQVLLKPNYLARVNEREALVKDLAERYGLTWYDFTDVLRFGGNPDGFYDSSHYDEINANLLLKAILKDLCRAV